MTRSKLSDLEKQEIVACFEQQQDTIPGLAERYQVSSSTIRRLLKQFASDPAASDAPVDEITIAMPPVAESIPDPAASAKVIILDKKPKLIPKISTALVQPQPQEPSEHSPVTTADETESRPVAPPTLRVLREDLNEGQDVTSSRRRSHVSPKDEVREIAASREPDPPEPFDLNSTVSPQLRSVTPPQEEMSAILEDLGTSLGASFPIAASEEDEDDDESFDEDDYDSDDDDLDDLSLTGSVLTLQSEVLLEVMPFAQAVLPKICYLVVDRTAELVTRPLKDFGELGQIPAHEVQSCTLPVFDNHRIARRFSHRTQRIIKVPDGNMLRSASTQLSAKGITRLLINGQIYAL